MGKAAAPKPPPRAPRASEVAPPSADDDGSVPDAEEATPKPKFRLPVAARDVTRVRVLMYHTFGWVKPRPGVQAHQLRDQLDWMREHDVEIVRMAELVRFLEGDLDLPARVAVITIDDGERNGYTRAFPIFKEYGVPFTLGIATRAVLKWQSTGALQWHQLKEMVDSGLCEIASHSHTHRRMTVLPDRIVLDELERPRTLIEEHTGFRPEVFFYPLGAHDARVRGLTRDAGYRAGFAASGAPVKASTRRYRIPRYDITGRTSLWTFARFFSHG